MKSGPPPPRSPTPPGDLPDSGLSGPTPRSPTPLSRPRADLPMVDFHLGDPTSEPEPVPPQSASTTLPSLSGKRRKVTAREKTGEEAAQMAPASPEVAESSPVLPGSSPPRPSRPNRPRRGIKPGWAVLSGLLVAGLLFVSWSQLPVRAVEVSGNTHLSGAEVRRLAGLPQDASAFGWLYYGAWKAKGLLTSPWIASADVTRQFPDTVRLAVTERQPFARWKRPEGDEVLVAEDGTVLPSGTGVTPGDLARLPVLTGWGPTRLSDALRLTRALSRYTVQSVTYTPAGFTAKTASGMAWGGDLETFVKYAGSIGMYPNKKIHIYPWGVSVQE